MVPKAFAQKLRSTGAELVSRNWSRLQAVSTLLLFLSSLGITIKSISLHSTDMQCVQSLSSWSPAWAAVQYHWETFQNDFNAKSIYKGAPTVEVEAAWDALTESGPLAIPKSRLPELGLPMSRNWATSPGGDDNVEGHLAVFRQIDCMSLLRRHTYRKDWDYTTLSQFQGSESQIMGRVDWCVQHLREILMCSADTTPYLIKLDPRRPDGEGPDFNTLHYCRSYDAVKDWAEENSVVKM